MPIFEYQCKKCGHVTSVLERAAGAKPPACEACGAKATERIFSTFAAAVGSGEAPSDNCASCSSGTCPYSGH